jgi:hypothetical protein
MICLCLQFLPSLRASSFSYLISLWLIFCRMYSLTRLSPRNIIGTSVNVTKCLSSAGVLQAAAPYRMRNLLKDQDSRRVVQLVNPRERSNPKSTIFYSMYSIRFRSAPPPRVHHLSGPRSVCRPCKGQSPVW